MSCFMYKNFLAEPVKVLFTAEDLSNVVALFDCFDVKLFDAKSIDGRYYVSYQDAMYPELYYQLRANGFNCCKA